MRPPNQVADIFKEMRDKAKALDPRLVEAADKLKDRRVGINNTDYTGTVIGANTSVGGFYSGDRYPVLVKIDKTNQGNEGVVFEYGFGDFHLIDDGPARRQPLFVDQLL